MTKREDENNRRVGAVAAAIALVGAGLRWLAVPPLVGDVDGVNFARALASFDPLRQAPHFPGYPVYVALSRGFAALGAGESAALALPAVVLWAPAAWLMFHGLRPHVGRSAALGAVAAGSLAPGAVLAGGWPGSDGLGLCLLAALFGALGLARSEPARHRWAAVAGAVAGVLLGVRLSWAPLAFALLAGLTPRRRRATAALALVLALAAWLVPLAAWVGPGRLATLAWGFTGGHLTGWGGAVGRGELTVAGRLGRAGWDVWAAGLGAAWPGTLGPASVVLAALLALGWSGLPRRRIGALLLLFAPYLLWAIFGQNVEKPRHFTPFLPLLGAGAFAGLARLACHRALLVAATLAPLAVAVPRAHKQGAGPAPAPALVAWVSAHREPGGLLIFAGEEARLFEHQAPRYRVWRPANAGVLARTADRFSRLGVEVWVTSGAPGWDAGVGLEPIATFATEEVVRAHDARLVLYRYRPGDEVTP